MIPIVSIVGRANSGKTTLLVRIIAELERRGVRVAAVKHHPHDFDIDHEGKDSHTLFQAGAQAVLVASPHKVAMVRRVAREWTLEEVAQQVSDDVDLLLTEGYKRAAAPKIEVVRAARSTTPVCPPGELIALATDVDGLLLPGVPLYDINDSLGLCDLLEARVRTAQ